MKKSLLAILLASVFSIAHADDRDDNACTVWAGLVRVTVEQRNDNIPEYVTQESLREHFDKYGKPPIDLVRRSASMVHDIYTNNYWSRMTPDDAGVLAFAKCENL